MRVIPSSLAGAARPGRPIRLALLAGGALAVLLPLAAPGHARTGDPAHASLRDTPAKKPRAKSHAKHHDEASPDATPAEAGAMAEAGAVAGAHGRVCIIDRELVNQQAEANVASNRRLAELRGAAQSDLDLAKQKVELQLKGIDDEIKRNPADAAALQKQRRAFEEQSKALLVRANLYAREIEATRQTVTRQLTAATTPLVAGVAKQQSCAIVIAREAVIDAGEAVDISKLIVEAMNQQIRIQPFALVNLAER